MVDMRDTARTGTLTRLGALAAVDAAIFAVLYVATVRTVDGRQIGDASLRGALATSPAVRGTVDAVLNVVSTASLLGAVALVAVIALLRLARYQGLAAVGILVAANVSALVLKNYLLPRPDLGLDEVAPATLNSLPSGHSTAAFSAVAALLFVLPRQWRPWAAVAGAAYATVTGLATMSAGWHRAADSMAAFLLVGFWTTVAAMIVVVGPADGRRMTSGAGASPIRWLVATAAGCLTLGTAVVLLLVAASPVRESTVGTWVAFFTAALFITGTAIGVLIGILRALDLMDGSGGEPALPEG
jgi:membrane-associated phospholipid phosphatase